MAVEGQYRADTGKLAAEELLQRDPNLTAIFASNDKMALGAYQALRQSGRTPGTDVAVIGCDDIPPAALADPPLTTVRMNFLQVGAQACAALLGLIERRDSERNGAHRVEEADGGRARRARVLHAGPPLTAPPGHPRAAFSVPSSIPRAAPSPRDDRGRNRRGHP